MKYLQTTLRHITALPCPYMSRTLTRHALSQAANRHRLQCAQTALQHMRHPILTALPTPCSSASLRETAEWRILNCMACGQFDNLKNQGRPLPTYDISVSARVLRNAGLRPVWIVLLREIDEERGRFRAHMKQTWERFGDGREWRQYLSESRVKIKVINRRIDDFNLIAPTRIPHLFRPRLRMETEVARVIQSQGTEKSNKVKLVKQEQHEKL